jgi:hypothetical protein
VDSVFVAIIEAEIVVVAQKVHLRRDAFGIAAQPVEVVGLGGRDGHIESFMEEGR